MDSAANQERLIVEKEATRVANQAIAALKASRKRIRQQQREFGSGVPTWTGRHGMAGGPGSSAVSSSSSPNTGGNSMGRRFGQKTNPALASFISKGPAVGVAGEVDVGGMSVSGSPQIGSSSGSSPAASETSRAVASLSRTSNDTFGSGMASGFRRSEGGGGSGRFGAGAGGIGGAPPSSASILAQLRERSAIERNSDGLIGASSSSSAPPPPAMGGSTSSTASTSTGPRDVFDANSSSRETFISQIRDYLASQPGAKAGTGDIV
ncbi:hypothetical protein HK102_010869, partial [Quaeritorhiza haematococci]